MRREQHQGSRTRPAGAYAKCCYLRRLHIVHQTILPLYRTTQHDASFCNAYVTVHCMTL